MAYPSLARLAVLVGVAIAGAAPSVRLAALDATTPVPALTVTTWSERDGLAPSIINALAQDRTGYLWLGTDGGLIRFDGVRFVRFETGSGEPLPHMSVGALAATGEGSLWIGFRGAGGISRLSGDRLTTYRTEDGVLSSSVLALLEDRNGTLWAGSLRGLAKFRDGAWLPVGETGGFPDQRVFALYEDRSGALWVAGAEGLFRLAPEGERFHRVPSRPRILALAEDARGTLWAATEDRRLIPITGPSSAESAGGRLSAGVRLDATGVAIIRDRDGNFWIATRTGGVLRASPRAGGLGIDSLTERHGLSNNGAQSLLEDREGNLWVGTQRGLNRLSSGTVTTFPGRGDPFTKEGVRAVLATKDGLWVGTLDGLFFFEGTTRRRYGTRDGLPGDAIYSLHEDVTGVLWVGTSDGIARFTGGGFTKKPVSGLGAGALSAMTTDHRGDAWLTDVSRGVFRLSAGAQAVAHVADGAAMSAFTDSRGQVWIGLSNGDVLAGRSDDWRTYTKADGLYGDRAAAIFEDRSRRVWVGTNGGLSRYEGGRFVTLTTAQGLPLDNVTAIVEDNVGYLWLAVEAGLIRLSHADYDEAVAARSARPRYLHFGMNDGLPGTPWSRGYPTAARGQDGSLWFVTNSGLAVVDPRRLRQEPVVPPVVIERVLVNNERDVDAVQGVRLPPRASTLQIDYTGLSFTAPAQVQFRYRLEGFDDGWVEAGTRRQAFYTNLPPRAYRFRVAAGHNDRWNEVNAIWDFSIAPTFYQTNWFLAACLLAGGLVVGGAWRFRVMRIRRKASAVLAERMRISRELHDTLLQSLVGIRMQFEDLSRKAALSPNAVRDHVERLRKQVRAHVHEARQSVLELRSPVLETTALDELLRDVGGRMTGNQPVRFEVTVHGRPSTPMPRNVKAQLFRIGQEALNNAVRHAGASWIRTEIHYHQDAVTLRVVDDGCGFDRRTVDTYSLNHWGLASMRERTQQVGGEFRVETEPGGGTAVEVRAPLDAGWATNA